MNSLLPREKVKDVLVTRTAIKLLKPEQVIEKVVGFQFKDAIIATKQYSEVEISGFGKFYISEYKTKKRVEMYTRAIAKYQRELILDILPERRVWIEQKIKDLEGLIIYLKGKL